MRDTDATFQLDAIPLRNSEKKKDVATTEWKFPMITVTPSACSALAELLQENEVGGHLVVRVICDGDDNLELSLEAPQIEDTVFSFRGRNVLAVEPTAAEILSGTSLDI